MLKMMKALALAMLLSTAGLDASILPIVKLEPETVQAYEAYIPSFEKGPNADFAQNGAMWIDGQKGSRRKSFDELKAVTEPRLGTNIAGGHIHHLFGTIRVPGATIEKVLRTMQDYPNYVNYFRPDITKSSGSQQPDSTPADQHFQLTIRMQQSTLWLDVAFESVNDTRYHRIDAHRVESHSRSSSIREYKDAHDLSAGLYPDGEDHGFLWKTYTNWHIRERDGGVDLELNNITLTRPIPPGFGWWATRKAREAVDKMINEMRAAINGK